MSVPAPATALTCVERTATELGYAVARDGPEDRLRVERQLKWTKHTPVHRWNRIEAWLEQENELRLSAGTLARYASRELTGRLAAPDATLGADLQKIEGQCSRSRET
ncbi:MAG: hypothetical protein ACR2F9_05225 [Longimicrobiaceae bacterium]